MKSNPDRQRPRNFDPNPFPYHTEISLLIESLSGLGAGVGRIDGWVVMVPFSLPGERIRARIWRNHRNHSDADLVEILTPSPDRVDPKCPLFGACGGCQYQHLSYKAQLAWKKRQIGEQLSRLEGISAPIEDVTPSPKTYQYRSKITPHFQKPRDDKPLAIGFQRHDSRAILDVPSCPIATEAINAVMRKEREKIHETRYSFRKGGTLLLRDAAEGVVTDPNDVATEKVGNLIFQFQAGEFFQNNPFILPAMVEHVTTQAVAGGMRYMVDAYCGVGVFGLSASAHFDEVTGIEIGAPAIRWANANAVVNRINNCRFLIGQADEIFDSISYNADKTAVVIDPPRKGCDRSFIVQLLAFKPKRIVYVSCHPASQARDVGTLASDRYEISIVQPFDLFPQTRHTECVITLERV